MWVCPFLCKLCRCFEGTGAAAAWKAAVTELGVSKLAFKEGAEEEFCNDMVVGDEAFYCPPTASMLAGGGYRLVWKWLWVKIKQEGLRRFWSMFPLPRVPFWYRFV